MAGGVVLPTTSNATALHTVGSAPEDDRRDVTSVVRQIIGICVV